MSAERLHNHGGPCALCEAQEAELLRLREMEKLLKDAVREAHAVLKQLYEATLLA